MFLDGGADASYKSPPDPHGAVGPGGILQVVNSTLRYMTRSGLALWSLSQPGFFAPQQTEGQPYIVDGKTMYDPSTGRFVVASLEWEYDDTIGTDADSSFLHVAVSRTSDPVTPSAADWIFHRYHVSGPVGGPRYHADYTCLGIDDQAVYVTFNMFSTQCIPNPYANCVFPPIGGFHHVSIFTLPKSTLMTGAGGITKIDVGAGARTLQPVTVVGPTGPGDVAYFAEYLGRTSIRIWSVSSPLSTPVLGSVSLSVPDNGGPISNAPHGQPSGMPGNETQPGEAQGNAFWRDGHLWFCVTAGGPPRSMVFHYDVATHQWGVPGGSLPTLADAGFLDGGDGVWSYAPSIGCNTAGDVCIVFTQSSATLYPRIVMTARKSGSTAFAPPIVVRESPTYSHVASTPTARGRWGDYSVVAVDPRDESFWVSHQIALVPNLPAFHLSWATFWANVVFPRALSWQADGLPVREAQTEVATPQIVPDGSGGSLIVWSDARSTIVRTVALRIGADGSVAPGWHPFGNAIGAPSLVPGVLRAVSDGSGGAYVAWVLGYPPSTLYAQHVLGSGALAPGWDPIGLPLGAGTIAGSLSLDVGPAGQLFVACVRSSKAYLQQVSGASIDWTVEVSPAPASAPKVTSDGAAGALVVWRRSDGTLMAQRFDAGGSRMWAADVAIASGATAPEMVTDGVGGAIVVYRKSTDLHAVRVTSAGTVGWNGGVVLAAAARSQTEQRIATDGQGGVLAVWTDDRDDPVSGTGDIYAHRLDANGSPATGWPSNGVAVCTAAGHQSRPAVVGDGAGGAVLCWQDVDGIAAHRITWWGERDGTLPLQGTPLCSATGDQTLPSVAATQAGVAVAVWEDARSSPNGAPNAVFANRLTYDATTPGSVPPGATATLLPVRPNPSRVSAEIAFGVPASSSGAAFEIAVFDLEGRRVRVVSTGTATPGFHRVAWDLAAADGTPVPNGVYFVRMQVAEQTVRTRATVVR
jgi:hypothetical protein